MNLPRLSVVMPVHNGMPFVCSSVESILSQTLAEFEFIIGDDGSSDGTGAALSDLAHRDKRIRLLRREHPSGLAAAANWVVSEAKAPIVAMSHADDRAYPERLQRQFEILANEPAVALVGTLWDGIDERERRVRGGDWWRLTRCTPFAPFSHSSIMFRRDSFERAGGYRSEADYWEDLDLYYRIAAQGRIVVVPEVLSTVRHARISTRLRDDQTRVEDAVDRMFRSTVEHAAGRDHTPIVMASRYPSGGKVHPMTFVSCGSTLLWMGRRPRILRRMLARSRLGADAASVHALLWVVWGTISPRSLRWFLRALIRLRSLIVRPFVRRQKFVEWRHRPAQTVAEQD